VEGMECLEAGEDGTRGRGMSQQHDASSSGRADDPVRPITLLQQRGIEAEVLIPFIRRLESEMGVERAHAVAREVIEEIARQQGRHVAEALGRSDIEGFTHVKESWGGAGGDLTIETLRQDGEQLDFNVVGCRFAEMYRQMGAEDLGFLLSCSRDFSLSEGYSGDLHLERTQTIMQGAAYCDFRYRLARQNDVREDAPAEPAPDV